MKQLGLVLALVLGLFVGTTQASPARTEAFIIWYRADFSYFWAESPRWQLSDGDWPTEWTEWEIGSWTAPAEAAYVDFNLVSWEGNRPLGTGLAYDDASITAAGTSANLVPNAGFEAGTGALPDGWAADSANGGVVADDILWIDDAAGAHSGDKYTILLTNENAGGGGTEPYFWPDPLVPVTAGATYDFSVWARSVDPGAAAAVPEPSTFALAALGLLGLGFFGRRRRRRAA